MFLSKNPILILRARPGVGLADLAAEYASLRRARDPIARLEN